MFQEGLAGSELAKSVRVIYTLSDQRDLSSFELNKSFLETVEEYLPDVLFWVPIQSEIWLRSLRIARSLQPEMRVICWATDDDWKFNILSRHILSLIDLPVTTYRNCLERYRYLGREAYLATWGTSRHLSDMSSRSFKSREYDVSFVGQATKSRKTWVRALESRGLKIALFGRGWGPGIKPAEDAWEIMCKSKISLNFSDGVGGKQTKARIFEALSSGSLLATDDGSCSGLGIFAGQHFLLFENASECVEKINFHLANPSISERIIDAGRVAVRNDFSYKNIFSNILNELERRPSVECAREAELFNDSLEKLERDFERVRSSVACYILQQVINFANVFGAGISAKRAINAVLRRCYLRIAPKVYYETPTLASVLYCRRGKSHFD